MLYLLVAIGLALLGFWALGRFKTANVALLAKRIRYAIGVIAMGAALALALPKFFAATAGSLHQLVVFRFLQGLCMPAIFAVTIAYVSEEWTGKGMGRAIMQFAENISRDRGYKTIAMHARKTAIGFYEKLGYRIQGQEFTEVTIPHYEMLKDL